MSLLPDWLAHPEEWELLALVGIAALVFIYFLLRLILARGPARERLPAKSFNRVLLPASGAEGFSSEAVSLACRLAASGGHRATVLLTYVIEVPRALAPDAPLPDEEAEAERALAGAAEQVRGHGLAPQSQVRKARAALEEILRVTVEEKADLLVLLAAGPNDVHEADASPLRARAEELARRAPCEVVLACTAAPRDPPGERYP